MRHIPRGKPQYEKLPTVFLNWDEMSSKLRADKFSGFVEVAGDDRIGFILFSGGRISGSLYIAGSDIDLRGQKALSKITMSIQERKGTLSIYTCSNDICDVIQWYIQGNRLYTPMESSFISWDKFLAVMKEKSLTGFIRVANSEYTEFIKLTDGTPKGHFVGGNEDFLDKSEKLSSVLSGKDTVIEVFLKTDPSAVISRLDPKETPPEKPEPVKPATPVAPPPTKIPEEPPKPRVARTSPVAPTSKPADDKKPLIPPDEIPDPFGFEDKDAVPFEGFSKMGMKSADDAPPSPKDEPVKPVEKPKKGFTFGDKKEEEKTKKVDDFKFGEEVKKEEPKTRKTPTSAQTMVSKPSGRVAFLLDGIRKVAQSNIGDDILPWLDGQISRIQSVNPKLTKRDLNLLVDEIERYVRQVRQNPGKAGKLATQLRHIIDSFASDL
jgi:hypothetical protein